MKTQIFGVYCLTLFLTLCLSVNVWAESGEGVYTRTLEIEVQPSDVQAWEAAVASLAKAAKALKTEKRIDWIVYRTGPTKYWVIFNRPDLLEAITLETLCSAIGDGPQESALRAGLASLEATQFVVTMDALWQHSYEWSTVRSMSTSTHPLAVATEYSVRPADRREFGKAMREYVGFLVQIKYPYPMESFRWCLGRPGRCMSVIFPDNWVTYHKERSLDKFADSKNLRAELARIRNRLFQSTHSVRETQLTFAPELSP